MEPVLPNDESTEAPQDRLLAVTLGGWENVLDDAVRIELSPSCTVLVGKNASGKSLILESIDHGAMASTFKHLVSTLGPPTMTFDMEIFGRPVSYTYKWQIDSDIDDTQELELHEVEEATIWSESCTYSDTGETIWQVERGLATVASGEEFRMPLETGLLRLKSTSSMNLPPEVGRIRRMLRGVRLLKAGIPRSEGSRRMMALYRYETSSRTHNWYQSNARVISAMSQLLFWFEERKELYEAVNIISKRLGVYRSMEVHIDQLQTNPQQQESPTHIATISVDGYDLGFGSDGTLRVLELVIGLVNPGTQVLLLEEPETAVHPGLLQRLLAEIESSSRTRQVVISTHSPIIVDWASPEIVRVVERTGRQCSAARLSPEQVHWLKSYLDNDYTMSDALSL